MLVGLHEAIHEVGLKAQRHEHRSPRCAGILRPVCIAGESLTLRLSNQSQESAPPVWYSITRVSKKLRSFFRSIISLIHGKGFSSLG